MQGRIVSCALMVLLFASPLLAQYSETIEVVAVEVPMSVVDRDGKVPLDLTKDDFEVFDDGESQEVLGLSYPVDLLPQGSDAAEATQPQGAAEPHPWQILVFFQQSVSTTAGMRNGAGALAGLADRLVGLGTVEIVTDQPSLRVLLPATRNVTQLRAKLEELERTAVGLGEIERLRRFAPVGSGSIRDPQLSEMPLPFSPTNADAAIEELMIKRRQTAIQAWIARYKAPAGSKRLMLFVSDGHPLDPATYHQDDTENEKEEAQAAMPGVSGYASERQGMSGARRQFELARTMAAQGWTVHTIAAGALARATTTGLESLTNDAARTGEIRRKVPATGIEDLDALRILAAETGGRLTTDLRRIGPDIDSLTRRLVLVYRARAPYGRIRRLEIRSLRPGLRVEARRAVVAGSPETLAAARATALALGTGERGELPVRCAIATGPTPDARVLEISVGLRPLAETRRRLSSAALRVALSESPDTGAPFEETQQFDEVNLSDRPDWTVAIPLRGGGKTSTAVVVEEITTGVWGGTQCETVQKPAPITVSAERPPPADEANAEALVRQGNDLFEASLFAAARQAFEHARDAAAKERNEAAGQHATLGLLSLDLAAGQPVANRLRHARLIAEKAATADVAASAWLLVARVLDGGKNERGATEAYTNAWRHAPRPSAVADAAWRALANFGAPPPEAVAEEVRLVYPQREVHAGALPVAAVAPETTRRVEYFLDGVRVDSSERRPFRVRIHLGRNVRPHVLAVTAHDAAGSEIGRNVVELNPDGRGPRLKLRVPAKIESSAIVELEASLITHVDVYWNERKLTTLTEPPYRYELTLPERNAFGYVRVVASDAVGAVAEAVQLVNASGGSEELPLEVVEVHALTRERNLAAADFTVAENGVVVQAELRSAVDDPITIGIAVDASASMRPSITEVLRAADDFVNAALRKGDQTFLIAFENEPHLLQPLTSRLGAVQTALTDVGPGGDTAVWDAMIYALRQFRPVAGKRALIVFTDGDDNRSSASPEAVIDAARRMGVPVYLFAVQPPAPPSSAYMHGVIPLPPPHWERRMKELAERTGGALFGLPRPSELRRLFEKIRDDTRNQYILTFVSQRQRSAGERAISVALRSGGTVQAMGGYGRE